MCWDNTQKLVHVRESTSERQNKMLLWANAYAVQHRVDCSNLDGNNLTLKCGDIPLAAYLPSKDDLDVLQVRMETLVERIMCQHIPHFRQFYEDVVSWHIIHDHSDDARQKSKLVSDQASSD